MSMRNPPFPPVAEENQLHRVFRSILFDGSEDTEEAGTPQEPDYFADLNLDQVVGSITAGREQYDLRPFYYQRLESVEAVRYRRDVFVDLGDKTLFGLVTSFAERMSDMRDHLAWAERLHYRLQQERWFLDAVGLYGDAVASLARDLVPTTLRSRGLIALREYLVAYVESPGFTSLVADTKRQQDNLSEVSYCIHIKGSRVSVRTYDGEADYSAQVETTFERFEQGAVKNYRAGFPDRPEMNHVEAAILDFVAQLFPAVFEELGAYCDRHRAYLDSTIRRFDREVQFYVAYLEYIQRFNGSGLSFCYPDVSRRSKEVLADDTFDLALADKLVPQGTKVVCNRFSLTGPERVFVVSGPNHGGKTTFARTFGQLHHLAGLGLPVPGRRARLFLFDRLFTHFEREEDLTNLRGKLEDDLMRIRHILNAATTNSIIIMNELFASTTLDDAVFLGTKVMETMVHIDLLGVYVTFVEELATLSDSTVSMVATVVPENPAQRTYQVVRRPADGLSYAMAIAEQYGLTYERLMSRIAR